MDAEWLTLQEAHRWLKIPRGTMYQLASSGRIPGTKIGRSWRFHCPTVRRWLLRQEKSNRVNREAHAIT